jgi:hypothetical protein
MHGHAPGTVFSVPSVDSKTPAAFHYRQRLQDGTFEIVETAKASKPAAAKKEG